MAVVEQLSVLLREAESGEKAVTWSGGTINVQNLVIHDDLHTRRPDVCLNIE